MKFNIFVENLAEKVHNLGADTLKVMLVNTAPVATNSIRGDLVEVAGGNGYTAGGNTITITSSTQVAGLYSLVGNDVVFTATGAVGPFRYPVIYNDTPTAPVDPLIGFYDYGASLTLATGETFTLDIGANILTLQ